MKKNLVICGGGSSAHSLIPFLKDSIFNVSILTSKPEKWAKEVELQHQDTSGNILNIFKGEIERASQDPAVLIPYADYIILCMPVSRYRVVLDKIAQFINKDRVVFLGTIYGQGGFNWMVNEIKKKYTLNNIVTYAFGLIPWICRTVEYGKIGVTYGCKAVNVAAVYPNSYFDQVNSELFDDICYKWFGKGKVVKSENFLSLTLSVDNQIIHTSRYCGLNVANGYTWKSEDSVPMFYRDYDDISSQLLEELDSDYSKIREKIIELYKENDYTYMLDYLALERLSYQSGNIDIKESFTNSATLTAIKTPVIQNQDGLWEIDKDHRFFMDDIYYGICIAKWIAEHLNIEVTTIDRILHWAQKIRKEEIIDENNKLVMNSEDLTPLFKAGLPCYYGFQTIDDITD